MRLVEGKTFAFETNLLLFRLLEPCDGCAAPYGYKHHMPLNTDTSAFSVSYFHSLFDFVILFFYTRGDRACKTDERFWSPSSVILASQSARGQQHPPDGLPRQPQLWGQSCPAAAQSHQQDEAGGGEPERRDWRWQVKNLQDHWHNSDLWLGCRVVFLQRAHWRLRTLPHRAQAMWKIRPEKWHMFSEV